jgi:sulfatase modifying factor 1
MAQGCRPRRSRRLVSLLICAFVVLGVFHPTAPSWRLFTPAPAFGINEAGFGEVTERGLWTGANGLHAAQAPIGTEGSPPVLGHDWRLREGKHWQIESSTVEDPAVTDATEGTKGACPAGMVEIEGRMKADAPEYLDGVDELQKSVCTEWIDREFPERCARFDRNRWLRISADLPTTSLHYCIDRFEYPNLRGAYPWIVVTWSEAKAICELESKRLCTESEWTFACEGEEASPYPYGYERDGGACVIDRPWRLVDEYALEGRTDERALREIDWLWQGEASGERPRCRSPFGVYDMTGNVDEWTTSARRGERPSILKGGYWGPVRTRCRPSTRAHGEDFFFYQQGFRCCSDASGGQR